MIQTAPSGQAVWNGVFTQRDPSIQNSGTGTVQSAVRLGQIGTFGNSTVFWLPSNAKGEHFYSVLTKLAETCDGNCKSKWEKAYDRFTRPSFELQPTDPDFKRPSVVYGPLPYVKDPRKYENYTDPGGRITQDRNPDGSVTNTTLKDHVFCCGTITRGLVVNEGSLYSSTVGTGYNVYMGSEIRSEFFGNMNTELGIAIFSTIDQQLKQYMNGK